MENRPSYPDDLSDHEWGFIESHRWTHSSTKGRKGWHSKREMLNAIFYLLRTGCSWRHLPHDFPPWKAVYTQFRRWRLSGVFERLHDHVRRDLRCLLKRAYHPRAAIVDSQSVTTTERGGVKGYDGAKKIHGRKRHIIVDTQGFLLVPSVTAAEVNDRWALDNMLVLLRKKFPFVTKCWADMGYLGQAFKERMAGKGIDVEIVRRPRKRVWVPARVVDVAAYLQSLGKEIAVGFKVLPRRWVVERTFAWIGRYRRMSKDDEFLSHTQEIMLLLTMTRTMLKRMIRLTPPI